MSETNIKLRQHDLSALRDLLRLAFSLAGGALAGALLRGGIGGIMKWVEEASGPLEPEMQWVAVAAVFWALVGAAGGTAVGLIMWLAAMARRSIGKGAGLNESRRYGDAA